MSDEFKERLSHMNERMFKKLVYYYQNKIPIHFCLVNGPGWKNGIIKKLDEKEYSLILEEFKEGELYFLLEEINVHSIRPFKKSPLAEFHMEGVMPEEKMKGGNKNANHKKRL